METCFKIQKHVDERKNTFFICFSLTLRLHMQVNWGKLRIRIIVENSENLRKHKQIWVVSTRSSASLQQVIGIQYCHVFNIWKKVGVNMIFVLQLAKTYEISTFNYHEEFLRCPFLFFFFTEMYTKLVIIITIISQIPLNL